MKQSIRPPANPQHQPISPTQYQNQSTNIFNFSAYETVKADKDPQFFLQTNNSFIQDVISIAAIQKFDVLQMINVQDSPDSENCKSSTKSPYHKNYLTDQECNQIDYKARIHAQANILNQNTKQLFENIHPTDRCNCGCHRGKGESVSFCADERQLDVLGPGVILQFFYQRALTVVLALAIICYGIFAFVTNILGISANVTDCNEDPYCEFKHQASDENKNYLETEYETIQVWLGLAFGIIWVFMIKYIKVLGRVKDYYIDKRLHSPSDYTIKIQNLPIATYSEIQLIDYFQNLWQKLVQQKQSSKYEEYEEKNNFKMKAIQIIYNMQFCRQMIDQIMFLCSQIDSLLVFNQESKYKNLISKDNIKIYLDQKKALKQNYQLLLDLRKKFINDKKFRMSLSTSCCLVEFHNEKMRDQFLNHYGQQKLTFLNEIVEKMKLFFWPNKKTVLFQGNKPKIQRAPEPSDILWINCEKKSSIIRKVIIYVSIFFVVIISFGIQMLLEYFQREVKQDQKKTEEQESLELTILNYAMSVGLLLVNQFLWTFLFYLLDLEYNHTLTEKIVSQMNHALFASSVNSIVLPILTNLIYNNIYQTNNLYKSDGLSSMVFEYHVSAVVGIITGRLIDPLDLLRKLSIEIHWTRNKIIRYLSYNKLQTLNFEKGVAQVNKYYQGTFYDVAENYVFMIGAIFHATFFCHLQPFIIIIVSALMVVFYITNRIKIMKLSKIPQMTELLIFEIATTHAGLVPIIYGVGSIVIFQLQFLYDPKRSQINYIPSIISIFIGIIAFMNPKGFMTKIIQAIMNCVPCLSAQYILGIQENSSKVEKLKKASVIQTQRQKRNIEFQVEMKEHLETHRVQFYYENSNLLKLFGLEKILRGKEERESMGQLQRFCEHFFYDQYEVNQQIIQYMIAGPKIKDNQSNSFPHKFMKQQQKSEAEIQIERR